MRRTLLTLLWLPLSACTYLTGDSRVLVTSEPAGAEIFVDGKTTGQWTPHHLDLGGLFAGDHEITVQKKGFEPESRKVHHYSTAYTSRWIDGGDLDPFFMNPIFWTLGDTLAPFALQWQYVPHQVYMPLFRVGEGPVQGPQHDTPQ